MSQAAGCVGISGQEGVGCQGEGFQYLFCPCGRGVFALLLAGDLPQGLFTVASSGLVASETFVPEGTGQCELNLKAHQLHKTNLWLCTFQRYFKSSVLLCLLL